MVCPRCGSTEVPERAAFCPRCGSPMAGQSAPSELDGKPGPTTELKVDQHLEGAQVSNAVGYEIKELRGDARIEGGQVVVKMSEGSDLKLIDSISTEVRVGAAAGIAGSKIPERLGEVSQRLDALIDYVKSKDRAGQSVAAVQDSTTQISRVDLMLKKAALLKIQAEQMMLDHVARNKHRVNLGTGQLDLDTVFGDFDAAAYDATLKEANKLLVEARKLDPTNTEVLLHLAEILTHVTPDDPSDEQKVLYEVQALLRNPKDDVERFRLAQATFLLSTSREPMDVQSLRDARDMFQRLNRSEWVRHCDDLLASVSQQRHGDSPASAAPDQTDPSYGQQATAFGQPAPVSGQPPPAYGQPAPAMAGTFLPVGRWNVRVMDAVGSTMTLDLRQDWTFHATQQAAALGGMSLEAAGQWGFNPANSWLQLQGTVAGFQPFMLGMVIQGQNGGSYFGVGSDGIAYVLTRA